MFQRIKNLLRSKKLEPKHVMAPYAYGEYENITPDTAMRVSAFHRGVIYLATQIAKLPVEIKDKKNLPIENDVHGMFSLWVNPEMNAFNFRLFMMIQSIIYGNAIAEIERDLTGKPKHLWPIYTQDITLERTPDGKEILYRVSNSSPHGGSVYLRPDEVFHIRSFHTRDGFLGQGIVAFAREALGISLGADRFAKSIFNNGGMPSGVLSITKTLSDEAFSRLKEDWAKSHGGRKTGGVAVLEEGSSFTPISYTPEVLQFLESRKFSVIEIARFLGLPPTKLYDGQSMTYNNIEHANMEVATDTIDAWARNWEVEINTKLLDKRHHAEFDLFQVFRADTNARSDFYRTMLQLGAMTPNEIRIEEGYAPYEGGDRYYMATNNFTPFDRMDEVIDSQIGSKDEETESEEDDEEDDEEDSDESERELNRTLVRYFDARVNKN